MNVLNEYKKLIENKDKKEVIDILHEQKGVFKGDQGEKGEKGLKGEKGERGLQGLKGEVGKQGLKGDGGERGEKGLQGEKGKDGKDGGKGDRGLRGLKGKNGITEVIHKYIELSAKKIIELLESQEGESRLDAKAIKNLKKYVKSEVMMVGGGGDRGNVYFWGTLDSEPSGGNYQSGDEYWNTGNSSLYKYISGSWVQIGAGESTGEGIGYWSIGDDFVVGGESTGIGSFAIGSTLTIS